MFWSFACIFFLCEFGQKLKNEFDELNNTVYNFDWYSFPIEMQRILPIFLNISQDSVALRGFGNVEYERLAFKSVSQFKNFAVLLSVNV